MADWKMVIVSSALKGVQDEMQGAVTELCNALSELQTEAEVLKEKWTGTASGQFYLSFLEKWQMQMEEAQKLRQEIAFLLQVEKSFERAEETVAELFSDGGIADLWRD